MPPLLTEDTGKCFEMACCLALKTPYVGKYKYAMTEPNRLQPRLNTALKNFQNYTHTAQKGGRYDFTSSQEATKHFSTKSTKKGVGKIAPQVVGQAQPQKFCEVIGTDFTTITNLKKYIQENPEKILPVLTEYTFDCPTIYYNKAADTIRVITLTKPIEWQTYKYTWTCDHTKWKNSSTMKIKTSDGDVSLVEYQFHTKSRTNMAVRWFYENFLTVFKDNLSIESY